MANIYIRHVNDSTLVYIVLFFYTAPRWIHNNHFKDPIKQILVSINTLSPDRWLRTFKD